MKRHTIKWTIFKYNLLIILMLIALTTIIFNWAIRFYIEKEIIGQLSKIAYRTEEFALREGMDFPPPPKGLPHSPPPEENDNDLLRYYFFLDRSLREPLTMLNADYILLDNEKNIITPFPWGYLAYPTEIIDQITAKLSKATDLAEEEYLNFDISNREYVAIIKRVSQKNTFDLGWLVIYSSLEKVNELQLMIGIILFCILMFSAVIIVIFSSLISRAISAPFSSLNQHIRAIAERKFGTKIHIPVDDELQEFVTNINIMSEKLETYDNAQKTFLQNVSHEFRTPLMSIQSYAEGIRYGVVDDTTAVNVIISESKRLTRLVEDLLYLSRLDTIEDNYHFMDLDFIELIKCCVELTHAIALTANVRITMDHPTGPVTIHGDEEKLIRAITNVLSNCIRHATSTITVTTQQLSPHLVRLTISDDGPGFSHAELPNIFERFYKGKKGNFGLGLAISKNVIEKHNGTITAENAETGAVFIIELPVSESQQRTTSLTP